VPIKPRKLSDDFVVPNRYPLFVDAYIALRKGQFDESVRAFSELASYYDIETTKEWGFALPYFALAAAQSGDKLELEKYLEGTFFPNEWGTYLAKAVFNGLHGKHDEARRWLNAALQERPATEYWPLTTDYEYAEICTWLFDVTHDASYRQQALDWARSRRKVEPTSAWSHALVARLSDDDAERIEALAMAIYLDPQSAWAQQAPASLRSGADAWLKQHPPFKLEKREESVRTL